MKLSEIIKSQDCDILTLEETGVVVKTLMPIWGGITRSVSLKYVEGTEIVAFKRILYDFSFKQDPEARHAQAVEALARTGLHYTKYQPWNSHVGGFIFDIHPTIYPGIYRKSDKPEDWRAMQYVKEKAAKERQKRYEEEQKKYDLKLSTFKQQYGS